MGRAKELSDSQCGTIIGCPLSNKSVSHISALLELLQSTVSAVIVKWKLLEAPAQAHKLTERDCRALKQMLCDYVTAAAPRRYERKTDGRVDEA
ncbi:hypothetical protein SKAU_G00304790 [Synaphobranchus kaupii]|uniref:Uncharacterized protein n=1 Tax=Synaphobranchus kaupii TaxID=118154 RepID=A0A9Q1INN2_SYNKA|nr:hypothetical protein SKAU_G00304790 [Synaphobranchus kaupii]